MATIVTLDSSFFDSLVVESRKASCVTKRMQKWRRLAQEAEYEIIGMEISFVKKNPTLADMVRNMTWTRFYGSSRF